jgi:hypothetical protein
MVSSTGHRRPPAPHPAHPTLSPALTFALLHRPPADLHLCTFLASPFVALASFAHTR